VTNADEWYFKVVRSLHLRTGHRKSDVRISDVARPLSYKTTYFFKTKTAVFKDHQIINPRPLVQPEILIERGPNLEKFW